MPPNPTVAGTPTAEPVDQFELMRRRLKSRGAATAEGQQRDLTRQFASLGNLPSGAALKTRQIAAQQSEQTTGEQLQDVNILQTQTETAQKEAAANRAVQTYGIQQGAETALGAQQAGLEQARIGAAAGIKQTEIQSAAGLAQTEIQAATAKAVETIKGNFGKEAQDAAIAASSAELTKTLASNEKLANLDASTKTWLGNLEHEDRMKQLQVSDETARYLSSMELDQQLTVATWEKELKEQGLTIQDKVANAGITAGETESAINKFATYVNALEPMKNAGISGPMMQQMMSNLGISFATKHVQSVWDGLPIPVKIPNYIPISG